MIEYVRQSINKLKRTGFFHIFGATVVNKILAFLSNFVVVRLIDKSAFGVYTYANNILSIIMIVSGIGMVSGTFQLCSENIDNKEQLKDIYRHGCRIGIGFNILLAVGISLFSIFYKLPIPAANILLLLSALNPIITIIFEFQQIYLRCHLMNREYSYASTINTVALLVFSILGSLLFKEKGLIIARYFAYIISAVCVYKLYKSPILLAKSKISKVTKSVLYKISIISMFNNGLSQLLYLLDVFVLGIVLTDETIIASYKVATVIPSALYFIPSAICTYIYPHFAMNKDNKEWTKKHYIQLEAALILLNLTISMMMVIFAPLIISVFFGSQYGDAVPCFRILAIGYFFNGSFRGIAGNLLVTQRRLKFNLFEGAISGGINIIGNFMLIPRLGSIGASYTTLIVMMISSFLSTMYYVWIIMHKPEVMKKD